MARCTAELATICEQKKNKKCIRARFYLLACSNPLQKRLARFNPNLFNIDKRNMANQKNQNRYGLV